jgi:hypothetical protein
LFRRSDLAGDDAEHVSGYLGYLDAVSPGDEALDLYFPGVGFEARFLFDANILALESFIRPPWLASPIGDRRFGEELIAIGCQGVDVDASDFDGPEAPAASVVAEIRRAIRRAEPRNLCRKIYHNSLTGKIDSAHERCG